MTKLHRPLKAAMMASAIAFSASTFAQTSVTIYGIVDAGLVHDNGNSSAGPTTSISGSQLYASRLGFKGREDLGNNLAAVFALETGFFTDTGAFQGGVGFGKQSFVGLDGDFGTLTVGNHVALLYNLSLQYDPFFNGIAGAYTRLFYTLKEVPNSVMYIAPNTLGGFNARAVYGLGEVPGDSSAGRITGLAGGYDNGPLSVKLIYNSIATTPVVPAAKVTTITTVAAGSYDFGGAQAFLMYEGNKTNDVVPIKTADFLIGTRIPSGANTYIASFIHHNNRQMDSANANQAAVGYTYNLSKASILWASYSVLKNGAHANLQTVGRVGGSDQTYGVGITHFF